MLRPGNFDITKSAAEAAGFKKGDKILDVGCGRGETMRFLTDEYGLDCIGVDMNLRLKREARQIPILTSDWATVNSLTIFHQRPLTACLWNVYCP